MEPTLRLAQVLKQEAGDLGYEGREILEYVKEQQALDRKEREDWRDAQKFHAEEKKRADEMAEIEAEAEKEERADEILLAQIEIDKELKIKEMELHAQQAQATTSSATTSTPSNKDAKSRSHHPL